MIGSDLKMVRMNAGNTPIGGDTSNVLYRYQLVYYNYYVAQSLIKLKRIAEAKELLEIASDFRSFGWTLGLIKKEAKALLSSL